MSALKSRGDLIEALCWCLVLLVFTIFMIASSAKGSGHGVEKGSPPRSKSPSKGMEGRIVGGVVPVMAQFPYQIAITTHGRIMCGGSLIKDSLVLTAAHCFVYSKTGQVNSDWRGTGIRVRGGEHNLTVDDDSSEQYNHVKRLVVHKNFEPAAFVNDIALIEVDTPFNLTKAVQTVQLATHGTKYKETDCTIAGWGYTHAITEADQLKPRPHSSPDTLSFIKVDIIKKDECTKFDDGLWVGHPSTLCAGKLVGGEGTCVGDSGGPLTCLSVPSGKTVQVGIASSGVGCAQPKSPELYANVAFMEPWLAKAVKALEKSKQTIIRV